MSSIVAEVIGGTSGLTLVYIAHPGGLRFDIARFRKRRREAR